MENKNLCKKYRNPLSRHIFFGCTLAILLLCATMGLISFFVFRDSMMQQYKSHLDDVLNLASARIDTEDLKECIATGEETEKYKELMVFFDQVMKYYSLEDIVLATPVKEGDKYDVIQVLSGLMPEERKGVSRMEMAVPFLGDRIGMYFPPDFLPGMYDLYVNSREITYSTTNTDFGKTYNAVMTVRDVNGEPVAQLTSGMTMSFIESTMRKYIYLIAAATILIGALCLGIMMLWFRRRVVKPIAAIERGAAEFEERSRAQKNPEALVLNLPAIKTGDEIESLSDTLSLMSHNMKSYVEELLESAVRMDIMELDLEESKKRAMQLSELAIKDSLTGIRNKMGYDKEVDKVITEFEEGNKFFGVAMIDLNRLKYINDTFGHDKGNIAIKKLCHIVCVIFDHSPVFRIGGDEFVAILRGNDYDKSSELIARFNEEIDLNYNDTSLDEWERISAAIGCALFDEELDTCYDDVFKRADKAMYERKAEMKAKMGLA